jgi:hypothetical protein
MYRFIQDVHICDLCYIRVAEYSDERVLERFRFNPFTKEYDTNPDILDSQIEGHTCAHCRWYGGDSNRPEFPEEVESWSWILIEDESDHALIPDDMIDEGIRLGFIEDMDGETNG